MKTTLSFLAIVAIRLGVFFLHERDIAGDQPGGGLLQRHHPA